MASGWSRDPTEDQQRYYELLRDVYVYEPNTSNGLLILRRKVGYAIYSIPDEESKCDNAHTGYSKEKYENIKAVVDFIIEINNKKERDRDEIYMAIIFVFVDHQGVVLQFPVFRILVRERTWIFIDTNCRYYSSWDDFLQFNELPKGKFCWPRNGIYSGDADDEVELRWSVTPAAKADRKVIDVIDTVSGVAALGATGVCIAGLFTPLGPLVIAATICNTISGVYTAMRSSTTLADRGIHGQTVNPLRDRQAALSWLSVAGSAVGVAAGAATSRAAFLARNGQVMSRTSRITSSALNATSLAVNTTGAVVGALSLGGRIEEDEATPLEVLQFTASLLFFAHATVSFQTASQIIKETQKGVIEDFEKSLWRNRKQFKKLVKNTSDTGENVVDGNARVIRGIRRIDSRDDFFDGMVRTRKDFCGHRAIFSGAGKIIVDGGAEVHPMNLFELEKQQRREFVSSAKQAYQGTISDATLRARFDSVINTYKVGSSGRHTSQNSEETKAVNTLTSQLQHGMRGITIGRHEVVLMMSVVDELTALVCSKTDSKYAKWWHYIWHHVSNLVREMCDTYGEALNLEEETHNFVDKGSFNLQHGIQMTNVFMHFVCKVFTQYEDHIDELINDVEKLKTNYVLCLRCKQCLQ